MVTLNDKKSLQSVQSYVIITVMSCASQKFAVDFMLGSLARNLRILGFDTVYIKQENRDSILSLCLKEGRVLFTRSHWFPRRDNIHIIETDDPIEQTREVVRIFNLSPELFSRCRVCNSPVKEIEKDEVKEKVPPYVFKTQEEFSICIGCGRVYWKGTHYDSILKMLKKILYA